MFFKRFSKINLCNVIKIKYLKKINTIQYSACKLFTLLFFNRYICKY